MILRLYSDVYQDATTPQPGSTNVELPYCLIACMQKLKQDKQIGQLSKIDPKLKEVDMIPSNLQLHCVRAQLSSDVSVAYKDIKSQNISLNEKFEKNVDEYLTSCLSSV